MGEQEPRRLVPLDHPELPDSLVKEARLVRRRGARVGATPEQAGVTPLVRAAATPGAVGARLREAAVVTSRVPVEATLEAVEATLEAAEATPEVAAVTRARVARTQAPLVTLVLVEAMRALAAAMRGLVAKRARLVAMQGRVVAMQEAVARMLVVQALAAMREPVAAMLVRGGLHRSAWWERIVPGRIPSARRAPARRAYAV